MALQKRRRGPALVGHRRSAWMASMNKPQAGKCDNCGEPRMPHRVCMKCGQYGSTQVIEVAREEAE
jgi:large subunit ribosomal protein L32